MVHYRSRDTARCRPAALWQPIVFTSSMVSKVLALAVIVAAVGAVAVETPLAGKSESGIESPAARSAEYEDAEEYGRVSLRGGENL